MDERLEETSRDGAPSLLRNCIDRRITEQITIEKTKLREEMRATVKIEIKYQMGLSIEIGRSLSSIYDSFPHGSVINARRHLQP